MISKMQFDFDTQQLIFKKMSAVEAFAEKWTYGGEDNEHNLQSLRKTASIESIGSSTRIEGSELSDEQVDTLITNLKITTLTSRDEEEVAGYYEALMVILENYESIDITENSILHLHHILLKHSSKDQSHKGQYKKHSNQVVATHPDGSKKVIFNTTPPFATKLEMEHLINWYNEELERDVLLPLMIIPAFIYEFVTIHPFQDGNGRMSRLLTTLLLLKHDFSFVQYTSFERRIEDRKKEYYQVLMAAQKHRNTDKEIIDEWYVFFLDCLQNMVKTLDENYIVREPISVYLNSRQGDIARHVSRMGPMRLADVAAIFEEISINTLKKDMARLAQSGVLRKTGKGKGTTYLK